MKRIIGTLLLCASLSSHANVDCNSKVKIVLDFPGKCNGFSAFKLEKSNEKYICSLSTKSDAIVLAAFMAERKIGLRLPISGATCETLATHYLKPSYIYVHKGD